MLDIILLKFFFSAPHPLPVPTHKIKLIDSNGKASVESSLGTTVLQDDKGLATVESGLGEATLQTATGLIKLQSDSD